MKTSETITEVAKSLVKFNSEVSRIAKDADNHFFRNRYSTLDTIIDEVRPILQKHGLSLMQFPSGDGQNVTLKTLLLHESGEWIESDEIMMKPVKNDPQAIGSAISYARRYSLTAFLSLNTGEDDDGDKASQPGNKQQNNRSNNQRQNNQRAEGPPPQQQQPQKINSQQVGALTAKITEFAEIRGKSVQDVVEVLKKQEQVGSFKAVPELHPAQANTMNKILDTWIKKAKEETGGNEQ